MGKIIVIGLGTGDAELLTRKAERLLRSGLPVYLRTVLHPSAQVVADWHIECTTFDALYEAAEDFDELNGQIAAQLTAAARQGDVIYAVPGQGLSGEETVAALLGGEAEVELIPGVEEIFGMLPAWQDIADICRSGYTLTVNV